MRTVKEWAAEMAAEMGAAGNDAAVLSRCVVDIRVETITNIINKFKAALESNDCTPGMCIACDARRNDIIALEVMKADLLRE